MICVACGRELEVGEEVFPLLHVGGRLADTQMVAVQDRFVHVAHLLDALSTNL